MPVGFIWISAELCVIHMPKRFQLKSRFCFIKQLRTQWIEFFAVLFWNPFNERSYYIIKIIPISPEKRRFIIFFQIPVYAFDKAFQVNNNIMHVFLGHNPWRCDCHFIPRFQGLLLKYKRVIRDLPDIRCSKSDDKTTSFVQVNYMQSESYSTVGTEQNVIIFSTDNKLYLL